MTNPVRIAFIGRKQGTAHRKARDYRGEWTLERPRKDEEAGLRTSGLVKTDNPNQADLVYVRINPERTNRRSLDRVLRAEADLPGHAVVINSARHFNRYADKTSCFGNWRDAGLPCPAHATWSPWQGTAGLTRAIAAMLAQYSGLYLRTSNEDSGKGIHYLPANASVADIKTTLRKLRWRTLTNKVSRSQILAVEPIDTRDHRGIAHVYRAHVAGDEILGGYALVGRGPVVHSRDQVPENWDSFVEHNERMQRILTDPAQRRQIIAAARALGADVGAVEFFQTGDRLCFLELNPMWGGLHRFGDDDFMAYLRTQADRPELRGVMNWLDAEDYYKRLYQALARSLPADTGAKTA